MGRPNRAEQFHWDEVGLVHVTQRCVRRAFLAGVDSVSGKDYGFRREWIRRRLELLSSVFGIDVLTYAIMSNHMHIVLRTRPDVVEAWSDEEVAYRWLRVFPGKRIEEHLGVPDDAAVEAVLNTPGRIAKLRQRMSDVSWFMKSLSEQIARLANKQDDCTGHFWEGRFKAQKIVDEAGLLGRNQRGQASLLCFFSGNRTLGLCRPSREKSKRPGPFDCVSVSPPTLSSASIAMVIWLSSGQAFLV